METLSSESSVQQEAQQESQQAVSLTDTVRKIVTNYLKTTKNLKQCKLYDMVLSEVEPPLLQALMEHTRYNQSKAAQILGLSRGTTRKKLEKYFGEKYFPQLQDDDLGE